MEATRKPPTPSDTESQTITIQKLNAKAPTAGRMHRPIIARHVAVEAHRQPTKAIRHAVTDQCHIQKSNAKAPAVSMHRPVIAQSWHAMRPWKRTGKPPKPSYMESHTKYHPHPKIERRQTATNGYSSFSPVTPRSQPDYIVGPHANIIRPVTPMTDVRHAHANVILPRIQPIVPQTPFTANTPHTTRRKKPAENTARGPFMILLRRVYRGL